ncbi:MAG: efflux RND transporter periplasmic adaptor subunit [Byssovorax sp.]
MKPLQIALGSLLGLALLGGGYVTIFHADWLKPHPKDEEEEKVETVVPVHVGKVQTVSFHRYVEGWGNVTAEPAGDGKAAASARIASPTLGVLAEARCAEGQRVEKGATLFQLDTRMASAEALKATAARASAKAAIERLTAAVDFNQRELERTKKLTDEQLTSQKDLHAAELALLTSQKDLNEANAKVFEADRTAQAAQTQAALLRITSPLAGTVVKINVNPGEAIEAATVLAEIVDLDRLVVTATIPAAELRSLKLGLPVEIIAGERPPVAAKAGGDDDEKKDEKKPENEAKKPDEAPAKDEKKDPGDQGLILAGQLAFLGFQVDMRNDTVGVRVAIPKDAGLRPGQHVRIRVVVEQHDDRLAVPKESVFRGDDGAVVSVVVGDKATQQAVRLGLKENGLVEVAGEGLKEGLTVVTAGAYALPKETKIRVIGE